MTAHRAASDDVRTPERAGPAAEASGLHRHFSVRLLVGRLAPALWVAGVMLWECSLPEGTHVLALLAATPALACAGSAGRSGIWVGGACALLALYPLGLCPGDQQFGGRAATTAAILCVAMASCYAVRRRTRLADELASTREVATAAQQALIRPLPPRIEGFTLAGAYLSAARCAAVGGDLYDVAATAHGVRVVIGDVRGHGLGAVSTVAAVLGAFREAAHDESELAQVLRRLERALDRHLNCRGLSAPGKGAPGPAQVPVAPASAAADGYDDADEEFVTVLLLEVRADGSVTVLNCGHPWPYRLSQERDGAPVVEPVAEGEPLPPLGLLPLPPGPPRPLRLQLPPGETLFLYTDGAEDARDRSGEFFPLPEVLRAAVTERTRAVPPIPAAPAEVVGRVRHELLGHTRTRLPDDVALLALRNDRCRVHGQAQGPGRERVAVRLPCSCREPSAVGGGGQL